MTTKKGYIKKYVKCTNCGASVFGVICENRSGYLGIFEITCNNCDAIIGELTEGNFHRINAAIKPF